MDLLVEIFKWLQNTHEFNQSNGSVWEGVSKFVIRSRIRFAGDFGGFLAPSASSSTACSSRRHLTIIQPVCLAAGQVRALH